jgi:hypothetical protein
VFITGINSNDYSGAARRTCEPRASSKAHIVLAGA